MNNDFIYQVPGPFSNDGASSNCMTVTSTPFVLDGYSHYVYPHFCQPDNRTEKAFQIAKVLIEKKRVTIKTPAEFITLVEELKEAL